MGKKGKKGKSRGEAAFSGARFMGNDVSLRKRVLKKTR
jgi:hypothetical protein